MARILTIFGPIESSWRNLFLEFFSKERNEQKVFEKFEKFSKSSKKIFDKFPNFSGTFVRFVRSKFFENTNLVAAILLVLKSSKSEPSSQFFGRLKFLRSLVIYYPTFFLQVTVSELVIYSVSYLIIFRV